MRWNDQQLLQTGCLWVLLQTVSLNGAGAAEPLDVWTIRESGISRDLYGITYGKGRFVAVGDRSGISNRAGIARTEARLTVVALLDDDADGIPDDQDQCPGTRSGAVVDDHGCSIEDYVPCSGPATGGSWRSHGQYVGAVASAADEFLAAGLITEMERDQVVRLAVHSDCGKSRAGR